MFDGGASGPSIELQLHRRLTWPLAMALAQLAPALSKWFFNLPARALGMTRQSVFSLPVDIHAGKWGHESATAAAKVGGGGRRGG